MLHWMHCKWYIRYILTRFNPQIAFQICITWVVQKLTVSPGKWMVERIVHNSEYLNFRRAGNPGVSRNSRFRPFLGENLWFPFLKSGNWFFHSLPVPEFWEWIFFIPFPFPNFGNGFFPFPSRSRIDPFKVGNQKGKWEILRKMGVTLCVGKSGKKFRAKS